MAKHCPRCRSELTCSEVSGIQIDGCHSCGGIWLDRGELGRLRKGGPEAMSNADARFEGERQPSQAAASRCPACRKHMYHYRYAAGDIELDTCDDHCGIWLDNGELHRIGQRARPSSNPEAQGVLAHLEKEARLTNTRSDLIGRIGEALM